MHVYDTVAMFTLSIAHRQADGTASLLQGEEQQLVYCRVHSSSSRLLGGGGGVGQSEQQQQNVGGKEVGGGPSEQQQ